VQHRTAKVYAASTISPRVFADTCNGCMSLPGDRARPKEFSTKKEGKNETWTFNRERR